MWLLCETRNPSRCHVCGNFVSRLWRYIEKATSKMDVCEPCAEKA